MGSVSIDGAAFQAALKDHLAYLERRAMDEVIAAGNQIRNEAMKRTPVITGALRAAWQVRTVRTTNGGYVEVFNNTKYVSAVEYGTRAHTIHASNKSVLANRKTGAVFGKTVQHPGTQPKPMIRPAVESVVPTLLSNLKGLK